MERVSLTVCLTLVQPVQSGDVVAAHLGGRAKRHIRVGDRLHGGLIVPGEGEPAAIQNVFSLYVSQVEALQQNM